MSYEYYPLRSDDFNQGFHRGRVAEHNKFQDYYYLKSFILSPMLKKNQKLALFKALAKELDYEVE